MENWISTFRHFFSEKIAGSRFALLTIAGLFAVFTRILQLLKWDNSIPRMILVYLTIFSVVWILLKLIKLEWPLVNIHTEIILVLAAHLLLIIFLYRIAGGPNNWDEFLYLYTAKFSKPTADILWRYTHIYLLQVAILFHPENVYEAGRLLWAFLISGTSFFIYYSVRSFPRSKIMLGVITSLLFLSMPYLRYAGFIYADFTVMFFITFGVWMYLLYLNRTQKSNWLLFSLGLICWLAINAKEIGIALFLLIPGFGFTDGCSYRLRTVFKRIIPISIGFLAGLIIFILLDGLILKDAFFHIRPENWKTWLFFNTNQGDLIDETGFIGFLMKSPISLLFLIICFSVFRKNNSDPNSRGLLFVLAIPVFVLIFTALLKFQVFERYTIPVYPILLILVATNLLQYADHPQLPKWISLAAVLYLFVSFLGLQVIPTNLMVKPGMLPIILSGIIQISIAIILLLIALTLMGKPNLIIFAYMVLIFVSGTVFVQNLNSWKLGYTQSLFNKRFSPLIDFKPNQSPTINSTFFVSPMIAEKRGMLAEHANNAIWILSTFYQVEITKDQIIFSEWNSSNPSFNQMDYIYIDQSEWTASSDPEKESMLKTYFSTSVSNGKILVLEKLQK